MRKSKFTDEQIAYALKQAETGTAPAEIGWHGTVVPGHASKLSAGIARQDARQATWNPSRSRSPTLMCGRFFASLRLTG
jgi:hypothetical protein